MDQRAIIDVICKAGIANLGGEVGALLGQDLTCGAAQLDIVSKAQLFADPARKKTTLTRMTVSGDREGHCYLLIPVASAAILGGTLIMLPDDIIEEQAASETIDGEMQDAFGEIANIIAGVFTQVFVDKYKDNLRFIKKSVEDLIPTKIAIDSDEPFPAGNYYLTKCSLKLADQDLGNLEFVVPASIFGLEEEVTEAPEVQPSADEPPAQAAVPAQETSPPAEQPAETAAAAPVEPPKRRAPFAEAKKLTDVVFTAVVKQLGEEVGALLGQTLECSDLKLLVTSKKDFFSNYCLEKSVLTHMKVTGEREGLGFLCVEVPDAVIMGGTLIMLPDDEIEAQSQSGQLEGEVADAFGEIANIVSGGLTQVFLDRYPKQIRYIKTDAETIVPTKLDMAAEHPFPEGDYYLASFALKIEGFELHRANLIFPADIFDLESQPAQQQPQDSPATSASQAPQPETGMASGIQPAPGEWGGPPIDTGSQSTAGEWGTAQPAESVSAPQEGKDQLVLVISDQQENAQPFSEILTSAGYKCQILSYQDEIRTLFNQFSIVGIFLLMAQVGEKGFATAIKLQSTGQKLPPLIFAGPDWTRSAVLRAVKYGAKDILVLPATNNEIQDKVSLHLKKAS